MKYDIIILKDAEDDIFDVFDYVSYSDSIEKTESLINEIQKTCKALSKLPKREHVPPELERIGIIDYKEIHYEHYRIIYRIIEKEVFVYCVLDSRRNISELLEKRILR